MTSRSLDPTAAIDAAPAERSGEVRLGLALGGGGARGLAHIHVLGAFDDLGVKPAAIAGSSIGALLGAAYASGLDASQITDYVVEHLGNRRSVLSHLWRTRAGSLAEFLADGGLRFGQFNAERILAEFLPVEMGRRFEDMSIPLTVTATQFYGGSECALREGDLVSALAASIALPAIFRPILRAGSVLVDGGISNPLPYDLISDVCDVTIAVDVTGPPELAVGETARVPTPIDAMLGASQLMMNAIVETKRKHLPPDFLIRPPVSRYRVLDFMQVATILTETLHMREKAKHGIEALIALKEASAAG